MKLTMDQRLQIELCGGATNSLFPQVEALLVSDEEAQKALFFVTGRKTVDRYQSLMDFLFCETFVEHRAKCRKFYEGAAPPLREELADLEVWRHYNRVMLRALEFAKAAYRQRRKVDWCWFVGTLKRVVRENGN